VEHNEPDRRIELGPPHGKKKACAHVSLSFGRTEHRLDLGLLPECDVLSLQGLPVLADPASTLRNALENPVSSPPLASLSRGRHSACIVVSDNTRPVPNELILQPLLELISPHVPDITILVANGLHPPLSSPLLRVLVGRSIYDRFPVVNHLATDDSALTHLGTTPTGIPVDVNSLYVKSDLKILTGLVEPHFMAGYSGGRKSVCPGIAGANTIQMFHSPALIESPRAALGIVDGNPVHEEAVRVARTAGVDFILNVAIDRSRRLVSVEAGDLEDAWLRCVEAVGRQARISVDKAYDILVVANGGYPLDQNFYQTIKGLTAAASILRRGGVIVMVSECRDGLGTEHFRRCLVELKEASSAAQYLRRISSPDAYRREQWQVEKYAAVQEWASRILVVTKGLSREDAELASVELLPSVGACIQEALRDMGPSSRVAILPNGPYVIPRCSAI
jgi:nickel-dependent lactate racemase